MPHGVVIEGTKARNSPTDAVKHAGEERVIIRANVQSIPGDTLSRPFILGDLFSRRTFGRDLRNEQHADGIDAVHLLPGFDSDKDIVGWFIYDIGVKRNIERTELSKLPHRKFYAHLDEQTQQWHFIHRKPSERLILYLAMYRWGAGELEESAASKD